MFSRNLGRHFWRFLSYANISPWVYPNFMKKLPELTKETKNETIQKLSEAIFELESSKGHLAWKVTDIVRKTKLSRSLIYRYLGSSKKDMLLSSLNNFVSDFYRFEPVGDNLTFPDMILEARLRVYNRPEAILFYQKWRARESWLQNEFILVEKKFQRQLKKDFPGLTAVQILSLHTVIHGLVTAPFLNPEQSAKVCEEMLREFIK